MRSLFVRIFVWFWAANVLLAAAAVTWLLMTAPPPDPETERWRTLAGDILSDFGRRAAAVYEEEGIDALETFRRRWETVTATRWAVYDADGSALSGAIEGLDAADLPARLDDAGAVAVVRHGPGTFVAAAVDGTEGDRYLVLRDLAPPRGPRDPRSGRRNDPRRGDPAINGADRRRLPPGERGRRPGRPGLRGPGGQGLPPRDGAGPRAGPGRRRAGALQEATALPPTPAEAWEVLDTIGSPARLLRHRAEPRAVALIVLGVVLGSGIVCFWLTRHLTGPVRRLQDAAQRVAGGDLAARAGDTVVGRKDEIGALGRDFDEMAARIEVLVSAQTRLLRDVSHELRSPLARLSIALGIARRETGGAGAEALDRIERESDRLNELIGRVLALARLEGAGQSADVEDVDLAALLTNVVRDADFEARASGRRVQVDAPDECRVRGVPDLLRSSLENVVRNAICHTAEGTAVDIAMTTDGPDVTITVRDHGPGVPEAHLDDLFRPFYREDGSGDGSGLGLAIAERAVRGHGGSIEAVNVPDGGLAVAIRLPRAGG